MSKQLVEEAKELLEQYLDQDNDDDDSFPIPEEELKWSGSNLWKPRADADSRTPGKLVVVLRADWPRPERADVLLKDGVTWEELTPSGNLEDGRHVFRGRYAGDSKKYAGVRKGGGVRIFINGDFGFIPLRKAPKFRQDDVNAYFNHRLQMKESGEIL